MDSHQGKPSKELTEKLVLAKSRSESLDVVKKINLWGQGITDVSIIEKIPELEIVVLSVNKVSQLAPFRNSYRLQELYLRSNQVSDLSELLHLRNLPCLSKLWLAGNPCESLEHYRDTVIRTLPNLTHLDDKEITSEERIHASQNGLEIVPDEVTTTADKQGMADLNSTMQSVAELLSCESAAPCISVDSSRNTVDSVGSDSMKCSLMEDSFSDTLLSTVRNTATIPTIAKPTVVNTEVLEGTPGSNRERSLSLGSHNVSEESESVAINVSSDNASKSVEASSIGRMRTVSDRERPAIIPSASSPMRMSSSEAAAQEHAKAAFDAKVMKLQETNEIRQKFGMKPLPLSKISEPAWSHLPSQDKKDEHIRTAALHLIEVLDHDSLLVVLEAIHDRMKKDLIPRDSVSYRKNAEKYQSSVCSDQ